MEDVQCPADKQATQNQTTANTQITTILDQTYAQAPNRLGPTQACAIDIRLATVRGCCTAGHSTEGTP